MRCSRRGATSIEYAILAAFLFLVILVSLTALGPKVAAPFGVVAQHLAG